jgi:hypothetical protein
MNRSKCVSTPITAVFTLTSTQIFCLVTSHSRLGPSHSVTSPPNALQTTPPTSLPNMSTRLDKAFSPTWLDYNPCRMETIYLQNAWILTSVLPAKPPANVSKDATSHGGQYRLQKLELMLIFSVARYPVSKPTLTFALSFSIASKQPGPI